MISATSLPAFSAGVSPSRLGQTASVDGIRPLGTQSQTPSRPVPFSLPGGGVSSGTRPLPRGSLLDLSV